jgi:uncharacterized YccA/Bax inhibitor family protein
MGGRAGAGWLCGVLCVLSTGLVCATHSSLVVVRRRCGIRPSLALLDVELVLFIGGHSSGVDDGGSG